MLAIRLPEELERRLADLAKKTGRTKTFYARQAIAEYIEDLEDYYLAQQVMQDFRPADSVPLDEVKRDLGLAD